MHMHLIALGLGWGELLIIGLVALLVFGKRLPEVARSLGRGVVEFKKGLRGIEDDLDTAGGSSSAADASPARQLREPAIPAKAPLDPVEEPVAASPSDAKAS